MKTRIEIETSTFVRFWLVLTGFVLAILAVYSARTALIIIAVAFFLALALNSPVHFLAGRLPKKSRLLGTAVAYIAIIATLVGFVLLVVPPIVEQTNKFIQTIPDFSDISQSESLQRSGIASLIETYNLQPYLDDAVTSLQENASSWAANIGRNVIAGAESLVNFLVSTFLVFVLTFLMLVEGPMWLQRIWGVYSDTERMEHHRELAGKMYRVVNSYIIGQLTIAAIGGIFAGLVVFALSFFFELPGNLALPTFAITAILSLIPMFGATLAGVLVALLLAFNSVTAAIIYAIYFFVYQQIENNAISTAVQSRSIELSALSVLVAATIGFYVFGLFGGLVSIPIAGCIKVLIEDYLHHAQERRKAGRGPIAKLVNKKT